MRIYIYYTIVYIIPIIYYIYILHIVYVCADLIVVATPSFCRCFSPKCQMRALSSFSSSWSLSSAAALSPGND